MSALTRTLRTTTTRLTSTTSPFRTFTTSSRSLAFSEADKASSHKDDPQRAQKIESHKEESVSKAKGGKGEWKPELASESEQSVKGERSDMSMEEMQRMGEKKKGEGKS